MTDKRQTDIPDQTKTKTRLRDDWTVFDNAMQAEMQADCAAMQAYRAQDHDGAIGAFEGAKEFYK